MIVATSDTIADKKIVKTLGLVRGNTIRARHLGKDILAGVTAMMTVTVVINVIAMLPRWLEWKTPAPIVITL